MTREQTKTLIRAMTASYPNYKPRDITSTVDVWWQMLKDDDYQDVSMALQAYIRADESGFAPSIGKLLSYVSRLKNPQLMEESVAWSLVAKAIRNSAYNYEQEFAKLPAEVRKAVGAPYQLKSWALDEDFNEGVTSSNFKRAYRSVVEREEQNRKLSSDIRALIHSLNEELESPEQAKLPGMKEHEEQQEEVVLSPERRAELEKKYGAYPFG